MSQTIKQEAVGESSLILQGQKFYPIESRFIWSNRYIQVRQSQGPVRSNIIGSATEKLIESLNLISNKIGQADPFEIEEKEGDAAHFLKVNYLTSIQMEHVLLQEIKKQEPYFEEEKRKIRLQLTPDETSQEFPAFLI